MPYPYLNPPPIDPTEPGPIPNDPKTTGIHTGFTIIYNWKTGHFEIGNAAFTDDPEGLAKLSQYLKHFTPPPHSKVQTVTNFPNPANHPVRRVNPKLPKKLQEIPTSELKDFLDGVIDEI